MSLEGRDEIILAHFDKLQKRYPGVVIRKNSDGIYIVAGVISFIAEFKEKDIFGDFYIEITLPKGYPAKETPPTAREIGGVIKDKFHVNSHDGSLCLGAQLEVKRKFSQNPTLLGFTEDLVIPFLYSFSEWRDTGKTPYGELSHGTKGIIEYYENFFNVDGQVALLGLLRILADDDYRGHLDCPCGSGKKLRKCHGKAIFEIKSLQLPIEFFSEYFHILEVYLRDNKSNPPHYCISRHLLRQQKKKK